MLSSFRCFSFLVIPMLVWVAQGRNLPRGDPKTYDITGGTVYAPNGQTCAAESSIKNPFGNTDPIAVRPDCDSAIEIVCRATMADYLKARQMQNLRASVGVGNKCEATILFSQPKLADPFDYASCVTSFQMITIECMLIQRGSDGSPGQQGGVVNVEYTADGGSWNSTYPMMKASDRFNNKPGYMVGPPAYFGNRSYGVDVSGLYNE
ncbi:MAG: hypothetical protein Q9196_001087 [Gyalolechia fulgens]